MYETKCGTRLACARNDNGFFLAIGLMSKLGSINTTNESYDGECLAVVGEKTENIQNFKDWKENLP